MSDLREMSINEIFNSIGINLSGSDLDFILNHNEEALEKIREQFSNNFETDSRLKAIQYMRNSKVIMQVLNEFSGSVDKNLLVMLTLYNHQSILETGKGNYSDKQTKSFRQYISKAIKLMGRNDVRLIDFEFDDTSNLITRLRVINSQELIRCIKQRSRVDSLEKMPPKDEERVKKIDEDIDFYNIGQVLLLEDIKDVASYDIRVGSNIASQISYNALRMFARTHHGIDEETLNGKKQLEAEKEKEVKDSLEFKMAFEEAIKANIRHIDINKLLLISAFRYIDMLENDDKGEVRIGAPEGESNTRESSLNTAHELISLMRQNISKDVTIDGVKDIVGNERKYSVSDLDRDLSRFVDGDYIRIASIKKVKEELLLGQKTLNSVNIEIVKRIIFTDEELITLIKLSEDNLIFLVEHNIVEQKEIYTALHLRNECSLELFKLIINKKIIDGNQILKLYEYGIIGLEHIKTIEDEELLDSISVESRVKEICISMQNAQENEDTEKIEHFNKISALYRLLKTEGKNEEEIREISNKLIGSFEENLSNGVLERLYQFGIISLDIAADWGIDLTEMMSKGEIKPIDLKRLYDNKTIKMDEIRYVLLHSELSYEEKLDLIYSTFDGESEEEYNVREELIQLLENGDSYRAETRQTGVKRCKGMGTKSKEYVTDPHARWKLISLLDAEFSKKFLPKGKEVIDGHRVFLLPNLDSIIIERMYEKKTGKKVNAYGSATYIMETEEFFKNIDSIIIGGAINRTRLRELSEAEVATKIIHSRAWGESIKRYFDINEENERYSEEEIKEIDLTIDNVNNSRRER